jgi:hypothetical protein
MPRLPAQSNGKILYPVLYRENVLAAPGVSSQPRVHRPQCIVGTAVPGTCLVDVIPSARQSAQLSCYCPEYT